MSTIAPSPLETLWRAASRVLLPSTCCLCGARGESPDLDLCAVCITLLPLNREPQSCLRSERAPVVRLISPFEYAYPVDAWVRALKFGGERVYARVLGVLLARARSALQADVSDLAALPSLIVPVPLHVARYRERGFNQAEEIARAAGRVLRVPVSTQTLVRRFATREQSGLSVRQRRRNVRRAFAAVRPVSASHVALVDDVVTTGSTALAAARALSERGVRQVEVWAATRAVLTPARRTGQ
ncbi:MAG TPA: ComF family protein [Steroidobacteraceae bacterium]